MVLATSYCMVKCFVISVQHYLQNNSQKQGLYKTPDQFFFLSFKCCLPPFISLAAFSNQMALPIASVQLGFRGTGHSAQASELCFFPFRKKKKETKEACLKHSLVTVELVRDEHFPMDQLKKQELLPVPSKQIAAQQVRIHSKQRAPDLQVVRHCAGGDQRKGNVLCTAPAPLFAE